MELRTPITRLRASLTSDGFGNLERDWTTPSSATFYVHWSPQGVAEVVNDEPQTVTRVKIFGTTALDLQATDRVVGPDGETYEVDGDVMRSYHPRTGDLHHIRAFLRRANVTGTS